MNIMKKQTILFITISMLIMLLTACASSELSSSQIPGDVAEASPSQELEQDAPSAGVEPAEEVSAPTESELPDSETSGGAPPAVEFSNAEEAVKEIKAVKAAGADRMAHSDNYKLYEKDHIYLLKETPLPEFEQEYIMLITEGTVTRYGKDKELAVFYWFQGYGDDEGVENLIVRLSLERYKDTEFFYGKVMNDIYIYWWEYGDEFCFMYPADSNIAPEDVIERIEVEKYDV